MVKFDLIRLNENKRTKIKEEFLKRPIALKVMDKKFIAKEEKMAYVTKERDVMNRAEFPGVCKLYFTFHDYYSLYLAMECSPEGDLAMLMKRTRNFGRLSVEQVTFYIKEVTEALRYCHETFACGASRRETGKYNIRVRWTREIVRFRLVFRFERGI